MFVLHLVKNIIHLIMEKSYLLPHRFKKTGLFLLVLVLVTRVVMCFFRIEADYFVRIPFLGVVPDFFLSSNKYFFEIVENSFLDGVIAVFIILWGILVGFCKTKIKDEFISQMRFSSLVWKVYINYVILFLAVLFVFDMSFLNVMVFNMFTVFFFFIACFHVLLHKANRL